MKYLYLVFFLFLALLSNAQENEERKWELSGYVKDMITVNRQFNADETFIDNLVHNRLNFRWYPSKSFTAKVELRSRVFNGDLVKAIPNYASFIDVNNDYLDLSVIAIDQDGLVVHTMLDRVYVQLTKDKWDLKVGRQRINWGLNLVWNPNDIFNAYSFFDFDYEERPGSDALRLQLFKGYAGGYEIAVKMADSWEEFTGAGMFKWNKYNYDFQALAGVMRNNLALGGGWAGNIKNAGFKGEVSYFHHLEENTDQLLASVSVDYSFPSSVYLNGSILYNSRETGGSLQQNLLPSDNFDVRTISPFKVSTFLQSAYQISPLIYTGLSTLYYPSEQSFFINPFITLSLSQNLDGDIVGQFYLDENEHGEFKSISSAMFFRMKYSF